MGIRENTWEYRGDTRTYRGLNGSRDTWEYKGIHGSIRGTEKNTWEHSWIRWNRRRYKAE